MSTLAEQGIREIDELSTSSGHSFRVSISNLEELEKLQAKGEEGQIQEKIRAMAIDTEAQMLSLYKLAVLKAKRAEDADQIAKIWAGPLKVYEISVHLISRLVDRGHGNPDLIHLHEALCKIRDQVRWVYELHAGQ